MKKCYICGFQADDSLAYCPNCGAGLNPVKKCPQCGNVSPAAAQFCPACGADISGAQLLVQRGRPPVQPQVQQQMQQQMPPQMAPQMAPQMPMGMQPGMPAGMPAQAAPAVQDHEGKAANRTAGVLKFVPSVMLIVFAVVCFLCFLGKGYSYTYLSVTVKITFFDSLLKNDIFELSFGTDGGYRLWIVGLALVLLAIISLIIGLAGFGKAARSNAGEEWTHKYKTTFNWGIVMYVFTLVVAVIYWILAAKRAGSELGDLTYMPATKAGTTPILLVVFSAVGIAGSIATCIMKSAAGRTYGDLDMVNPAAEAKKPATHIVRTRFYWTIIGRTLLFLLFGVLLLLFYRFTLVEDYSEGNGSLYNLLSDDLYELSTPMWIMLILAAFSILVGFCALMRDIGARRRILDTEEQEIGAIKNSLFIVFLYCLILGAVGYAYGKVDQSGLLYLDSYMSAYGMNLLGPMLKAVEALTIVCLVVHLFLLIMQCVVYNSYSFSDSEPAQPGMPAGYPYPQYPQYPGYPQMPMQQAPYNGYAQPGQPVQGQYPYNVPQPTAQQYPYNIPQTAAQQYPYGALQAPAQQYPYNVPQAAPQQAPYGYPQTAAQQVPVVPAQQAPSQQTPQAGNGSQNNGQT